LTKSTAVPDTESRDLQGTRVLVTRPRAQAQILAQRIEQAGGEAVLLPSIEIAGPADESTLNDLIDRLASFDIAIFVSPNAVHQALLAIGKRIGELPKELRIGAVGAGTARALAEYGHRVDIAPQTHFRSETLLQTEELQDVTGKRVVIFRGVGGRTLLADTLRERGAEVEYAECYQRLRPETDTSPVEQDWEQGAIDIVVLSSGEGLDNLLAMLSEKGRTLLRETPVVVISPRMLAACERLGLRHTVVAREASDEGIVDAVRTWRRSQNPV
jgi:uroporphyrinogen-III synthase